ncbi:MgtC/SapB family protein [Paenibacillus paridis]|uniref:MgtC/SapB family protein n=1 Tax=Paenibacillus paridis TaxID=2583376 RepID=UPI0011202DAE|nr:MgtC/SapB family protein [Paenibacillus paridis]
MDNPWFIDNSMILIRLLLAVLLGGLIGFEREFNHHPAGFRTHILVSLGSALIMMLSIYGFADFIKEENVRVDPARLATAVITGIGFLGAGTIMFTGKAIKGLTTAASLWVVASIGLGIGAGFYFATIAATGLVLINLFVFNIIEKRFLRSKKVRKLVIQAENSPDLLENISVSLIANAMKTHKMSLLERKSSEGEADFTEVQLHIVVPRKLEPGKAIVEFKKISGVFAVSIE